MSGTRTKMIVDIATDRIIWFGPMDFPLDETNIDGAALAFYEGPLPAGLKSTNAWNFRLQNQKIVAPAAKIAQVIESTIDVSRKVTLKAMRELIDKHRASNGVPQSVAEYLLCVKLDEATSIVERTEELYQTYNTRVQEAIQSSDLLILKNEFIEKLNEIKT